MPKTGQQKEQEPDLASIKCKSGNLLSNGGGIKLIKLIGKRGSGKSRFYLSDFSRVAEDIAKNDYNRDINWSSKEDCDFVEKEVAPKMLMCIIDMDMKGTEELMGRSVVIPPCLLKSVEKWSVTGIPDKDVDAFEESQLALQHFLLRLADHAQKYPEYRFARYLVLESEESVYVKGKDHYVKLAYRAENVKDVVDLQMKARELQVRSGKFAVVFRGGPREEYGQGIYPLVSRYLTTFVAFSGDIGFNVIMTAHVVEKMIDYGKDTQKIVDQIAGAPQLSDGFFDAIILFEKAFPENEKSGRGKAEYYLSTETVLSKNRMCEDITLKLEYKKPSDGAKSFWNEVKRLQTEEKTR